MTNCLVTGNNGGFSSGGIASYNGTVTLTNCTIAGNTASVAGGIYCQQCTLILRNSIVYNNSNGGFYNYMGTLTATYSLLQDDNSNTDGNISGSVDPLFVAPLSPGLNTGGDYRLQNNSPLIDKGSNSYFAAAQTPDLSNITTDLDDNTRIYNNTVDMGAYEYQPFHITASARGIIYVKPGASGTGRSWPSATGDLQAAIDAASNGNQVWVAAGSYIPTRNAANTATITTGDRNNAFVLKDRVGIYGGFAGTETTLNSRNSTASQTILSGDLSGNNTYHVIISAGNNNTAILDGFTISGGNANGSTGITVNGQSIGTNAGGGINTTNSTATFANLTIKNNAGRYGAGISFSNASPTVYNSSIIGNAGGYGGAMISSSSAPILTNVLMAGNTAYEQGGAMYNEWAPAPILTNVTIAGNAATYDGGAMYNTLSVSLQIRNSIIDGNSSGIYNNAGSPTIQYSLVQDQTTTDPLFTNSLSPGLNTGGDYTLQTCSPAINSGNNSYYVAAQSPDLSTLTTDLANTTRIQGYSVDMGAYEYNGNPALPGQLAVNGDQTINNISTTTVVKTTNSNCRLIANILPISLSGNTTSMVWIETTQPVNYVKRHYQITPDINASTATATVTLYFTQSEFNDFNAVNTIKLPTGPSDAAGIANLLIEKRSGTTSDGSGIPFSYNSTITTIDPIDANIVWNSTYARWEVSFPVTGFSGFFVKTQPSALPFKLLSFTGTRNENTNILNWTTTNEINTSHFDLERSTKASIFTGIASIPAKSTAIGTAPNTPAINTYIYNDANPATGTNNYRLKMIDIDGNFTYSSIFSISNNTENNIQIFPNPAGDNIYISSITPTTATLLDATGCPIQHIVITASPQPVDVHSLPTGLYLINFANGQTKKFMKK